MRLLDRLGLWVAILAMVAMVIVVLPVVFPSEATVPAPSAPALAEPAPGGEAAAVDPGTVSPSTVDPGADGGSARTDTGTPPLPGPPALVANQPLGLRIPSLGLATNVGAMAVPENGQVNPPTPLSAYWIRGYGSAGPASDNTTYIAGHTFRSGDAVFNSLLDVPQSAVTISIGDEIVVTTADAEYHYTVTSTALYDKAVIGQQSELWQAVPGRLALITCFQYSGGTKSTQNVVVYALLDD